MPRTTNMRAAMIDPAASSPTSSGRATVSREGPGNGTSPLVFFRHLPKTAGTSLITALANAYGDAACSRLVAKGDGFEAIADEVANASKRGCVVLSGHAPLTTLGERAYGEDFTILRDPIARVLSLRRFLETRPPADRRRLGLGDRVSIGDMLASVNPEVHGQTRNGMVRFFSEHRPLSDPETAEFWASPPTVVLDECTERLRRMTVGTVEDMPTAMFRLQRRLRLPYRLELSVENMTRKGDDAVSIGELQSLIEANASDLAVYRAVMETLRTATAIDAVAADPRALFNPQPGRRYAPPMVPGRQGFDVYEPESSLSWIADSGWGRIYLAPSTRPLVLSFRLHPIMPHYPLDEVVFVVDGSRWPVVRHSDGLDLVHRLATIPAHEDVLEIGIHQPYAVPVAAIQPDSPDPRRLGVGLLHVICDDG